MIVRNARLSHRFVVLGLRSSHKCCHLKSYPPLLKKAEVRKVYETGSIGYSTQLVMSGCSVAAYIFLVNIRRGAMETLG